MDAPTDPFDSAPRNASPSSGASTGDAPTTARLRAELEHLRAVLSARMRERDESEARFHAVVESNADGIVVVDPTGTIRFANQPAQDLFGIPLSALVGQAFGHPLVNGQTTEVDLLRPRRSPVVVEMRVVATEWEGEAACLASLRDITDRRHAEESARGLIRAEAQRAAAEETSARFRFLAEAGSRLASSLDHREALETLARICVPGLADWAIAYGVEESGKIDCLAVEHADADRAEVARALCDLDTGELRTVANVLETHEPLVLQGIDDEQRARLVPDPRRRRIVEELGFGALALLPLRARDRNVGAVALVRTDPERGFGPDDLALAHSLVSRASLAVDNARLYQAARKADQGKTDLIAVISHDLRTPLNSIIGYADLLELGVAERLGDQSREWVRRIRGSAEHQTHLIDQLLAFSRAEAGVELRPIEIDLGGLLEEVAEMVAPLAESAGLALHVDAEPGVRVRCDSDALRQVVLNLATNAVKYTERGEVRMSVAKDGDDARLRVADTGIGIAREHLGRIFDPFWQADPSKRGTGLGLSIVRRLARSLGGDIAVESEPGRGSTFALQLPICD